MTTIPTTSHDRSSNYCTYPMFSVSAFIHNKKSTIFYLILCDFSIAAAILVVRRVDFPPTDVALTPKYNSGITKPKPFTTSCSCSEESIMFRASIQSIEEFIIR